jgi:hypothetical protein
MYNSKGSGLIMLLRHLPNCLIFVALLAGQAGLFAQESGYKSIHRIQAEEYRDLAVYSAPGTTQPQPLPPQAVSNVTRTVFGFFPYWAPGFSQIRFQDLSHLAVFSVEADANGQLVNLRGWPNAPLIEAAHRANVRVVLVCTLFDSSALQSLLSDSGRRQTLIGNLKAQVLRGGAEGVNIDFEGVPASQKNNLVVFMKELALEIKAAVPGAHISIDTPAVDWSNGWDYAALADICDALMIMAYDYHWSGSKNPGPVSPLSGSGLWGKYSVSWTIADYLGSGDRAPVTLALPPLAAVEVDISELFGTISETFQVQGSVLVSVIQGQGILGSLWLRTEDFKLMAALTLERRDSTSFSFPQLAQAQGYWTGISIANPGVNPCTAVVEARDDAGSLVGACTVQLNAGEVQVGLVWQWIRSTLGVSSGRVNVNCSGALIAAEIFGSDSLSFMAAVPGR